MDLLIALLGISTMAGGLIGLAWYVFGREVDHLAGMYQAPSMGWPRGVQEEDPPPSWSWRPSARAHADRDDPPRIAQLPARSLVAPHIGRGSSRRHGHW